MTKILYLSFCFLFQLSSGQTQLQHYNIEVLHVSNNNQKPIGDSVDIYISKLGCNSAIVTTTYIERLLLDLNGQRLVSIKDKNLNRNLLSHLDDPDKVLAIHIILTRRLKSDKSSFDEEYVYDNGYKNVVRVNYTYNNFHWFYLVTDNNTDCFYHIDKSEILKAKL